MESWNERLEKRYFEILKKIYMEPPPSNLPWTDIESLLEELVKVTRLGGIINSAPGARVRIKLDNMVKGDLYQPYPPENPTISPLIRNVRGLLTKANVKP